VQGAIETILKVNGATVHLDPPQMTPLLFVTNLNVLITKAIMN